MKLLFVILAIITMPLLSAAQKLTADKVPQAVKNGLLQHHPNVKASWEWEDKNYEANFTEAGKNISCILTKEGSLVETETMIALAQLPARAKAYMDKTYKNKKIKEVSRIETANGAISYEVVTASKEITFDANGNLKATEEEKKDD